MKSMLELNQQNLEKHNKGERKTKMSHFSKQNNSATPSVTKVKSVTSVKSICLFISALMLVAFISPPSAKADENQEKCLAEVKALFSNEFNAYNWPPYKSVRIHTDATGKKTAGFDNVVETPLRTISLTHGSKAALAIDQQIWVGPTVNGPWKKSPNNFPKDRQKIHAMQHAQSLKNMTDAKCEGEVELNGKKLMLYKYSTKTDPIKERANMWFGGTDAIYYDPKSRRVMRRVQTDFINSFTKGKSKDVITEDFTYDPEIKILEPKE